MAGTASAATHPLDPIQADEIRAAVAAVRASGKITEGALFASVTLEEPSRSAVAAHRAGQPFDRRVRLTIVPGPEASVIEALVALPTAEIVVWTERDGVRPALLFDDAYRATIVLRADPDWREAMRLRGITDFEKVQIDPWPTGCFGRPIEDGRRIVRCLSYYREEPSDNGYARPVEGVLATVDAARGVVLEMLDLGLVPLPPERGSYRPEDNGPLRTDLRPLEVVQPEGPSFTLAGNLLTWQRWSMRLSMNPIEGLVLHTVGYDDGGSRRSILHRASVSEMVVPYGDPGPMHGWKNAFDCGEWGLGRMANSLESGCDCLGEIAYLDATFASEHGKPYRIKNAICVHEEDYGILWKHLDMHTSSAEVRRSRRLVVSFIATVGNYEYGFYWYFYLDGTIQLEVKLTGIMSTQAVAEGETTPWASAIAPGLAAPFHQHLFCARLDVCIDGPVNEAYEVSFEPVPTGPDNPLGNAISQQVTRLDSELQAIRDVDPAHSRHWVFVNPARMNRLGRPVAYKLVPGATPTMLAQPDSSVGQRAGFARHNLWVTPCSAEERRAAGDYPNQHPGGDGLLGWTAADRSLLDTEIVAWHTFGVTHSPRPEDWPVTPVEYCGFQLVAVGFFDRNPALDLPGPTAHCD
jgi:primary-amine oxidase